MKIMRLNLKPKQWKSENLSLIFNVEIISNIKTKNLSNRNIGRPTTARPGAPRLKITNESEDTSAKYWINST